MCIKNWQNRALVLVCLTGGWLLWPSAAFADLYTYETPSGEILVTSEKMPGYKLISVIEGGDPPARAKSSSNSTAKAKATRSSERPAAPSRHAISKRGFRERERAFDDIIREASETYDVPFGFIKAVIRVESAFQPDAVSHAGAQGLMQLMPRTAASLNVTDPFDPRQNIFGGAKFLRILIDRYDGDINLILAAYNAGDVAVKTYDGIPYSKTRQYVASVYHWYQVYSAKEDEASE